MPSIIETIDAAADTGTLYSIGVGQSAQGTLNVGGDHDWYRIDLVAGQTYTFALTGTGTNNVRDTYLRLYDSSGTVIMAQNDDGLPGHNSIITFTASSSGTYYLDAAAFDASEGGGRQYGLSVTAGNRASFELEQISGVIDTDLSWSSTPGTAATVTYGFRQTTNGDAPNFSQLTAVQIAAVESALQLFSDVAGLTFSRSNPAGYTDNATMLFANYFSTTDGAGAYAYYPGSTASTADAGDVWLNTNSVSTTSLPHGQYSYFAIMHEIGHAVGLSHPGLYNAGQGVTITYADHAQFRQDTHQYTVLSYFDESNTTTSFGSYPDTLMLGDILALQNIYGVNSSTRAGDTVYGFGSNAGAVYDFSLNSDPVLCIWDGGGGDTLNASGFSQNQIIDLRAAMFSSIGGLVGNVSIAFGAVIENGVGGSGHDTLIGNAAANTLNGAGGSDTVRVAGLNGAGSDILNFGGAIYSIDRSDGTFDTLVNIESYTDGFQTISTGQIDLFDGLNYAASYNDLALAFRTDASAATWHYLTTGFDEEREVSFNPAQYLANYADLQSAFGGNLAAARNHFLTGGVDEHRLAEDPFDYIASFADLISAFHTLSFGQTWGAGLSHYQASGWAEGRRSGIDFDVGQYLANHADLQSAFGANDDMAAWHFISSGYGEGRLWEDPLEYVASFGDLISAYGGGGADQIRSDGLMHFRAAGFSEGRRAGIEFDADQYLANYADLRAAFADGVGGYNEDAAMLHFVQAGYSEGRTDDVLVV